MTQSKVIHRVVPNEHENIIGFLMRVSERNYLIGGPRSIIEQACGNVTSSIKQQALPNLAEYCRISYAEISQLSGIEQIDGGFRGRSIGGEWVTKHSFTCHRRPKVCPCCLAENGWLRGYWDLTFYNSCALHRIELVDRCPGCARPLKWDRRFATRCGCGCSLASGHRTASEPTALLVARLIEKQPIDQKLCLEAGIPEIEVNRLAKLSIDGLCKTIWFLGHCLRDSARCVSGHGRIISNPTAANEIALKALGIFSDWPDSFGNELRSIAYGQPRRNSGTFLDQRISPLQNYLKQDIQDDELTYLRIAFEHYIRRLWAEHPSRLQSVDACRQYELPLD